VSDASLIVRGGKPEDLPAVEAIELACFGDPWSRAALASELQIDRLRLPLVAERAGCVVGYLMAWRIVDQLHVLNIAVRRDRQRSGVGTALLRAAAAAAARAGLAELTLEVRRGNRSARSFYRRHGFVEIGVRPGYYPDTGEDALVLACPVSALCEREGGPAGPADPGASISA
jgi:ribosomal-protein-alanine N-acetyltransferase